MPQRLLSRRACAAQKLRLLLLAILASVCGWASRAIFSLPARADDQPASHERLVVSPDKLALFAPADRQRLVVTAIDAAGFARDVTGEATFVSSAPGVARVEGHSECIAAADGDATVSVSCAGQTLTVPVSVKNAGEARPPSFVEDVIPLFTRLGCNQGACHGKNDGRNGFKLSLRGYAPEWDIERLTRESRSRRVNLALPENSLILRKPTGALPHGGGTLIEPGTREYKLLLDWITAGAPGPIEAEPHVAKIEILPGNLRLRPGSQAQLLVRATYADGRTRDVTWLTQFAVNDRSVLEVSRAGVIKALREGEAAVRAHFRGQVAVAIMTMPHATTVDPALFAERKNVVDQHVFNKLAALQIPPSQPCTDLEFLRRSTIDTIGTLPTAEEIRAFAADTAPDKRIKSIDRLLERPEFVDYWAVQWSDLLQNRKERDHDVRGAKAVRALHQWLRDQVAANRPWDEIVRAVVTASGDVDERPEVGYFVVNVGESQNADQTDVVSAVAQAFLGTRIGCAKCHNHPLEKYTQDDYYHFAAYFAQLRFKRSEPRKGTTSLSFASLNKDQKHGVRQPRTGQVLAPQAIDGTPCDAGPTDDPRLKLAAWMTDPKNEYFAGAMVNRLWAHFMGAGLVEPVDDLRASNPPSNPELWRALVGEFVAGKYDVKRIMRLILNSRAYQLSAKTRPENEADIRFYSHHATRRLEAEVLCDAVSQATGVPEPFPGYPLGIRAIQLPDPAPDSYFLVQFGKPQRVTGCVCERRSEVTISQLLELQNSEQLSAKINSGEGRLAQLLRSASDDHCLATELFLSTLGREPKPEEVAALDTALAAAKPADGKPATASREDVFRDLFWALLNSKEFVFNH